MDKHFSLYLLIQVFHLLYYGHIKNVGAGILFHSFFVVVADLVKSRSSLDFEYLALSCSIFLLG